MKKLGLLLFFIFTVIVSFAQFPANVKQGNTSTNNVFLGAISGNKGIVTAVYNDTIAANNDTYVKGVPNIIITTKNNNIWKRNALATKWLLVSSATAQPCVGLQNGGLVTYNSGFSFSVNAAIYCINGNSYNSLSGDITLNNSDPSLPRLDVIALDTFNNIIKITGVPASNPAIPQVNLLSQLYLTSILVPANSTAPIGISLLTVYDENTEWATASFGNLTSDFNSTTNPYHLTKCIALSNINPTVPTGVSFTNNSQLNINNFNSLKLYITNNSQFSAYPPPQLKICLTIGGMDITPNVLVNSEYANYENITIPSSSFTFNSPSQNFDGIKIQFTSIEPTTYNIDYITLQSGIVNTSSPYITNIYRKQGSDSVFKVINSIPYFAYKDSVGSGSQILDITYSATSNQTDFATPTTITDIKRIQVFRNGVENQITQITSNTVRIPVAAVIGDRIKIVQSN